MPTLAPEGMSERYGLFRSTVNFVGKVILGFELHGEELVPKHGPVIVAANHRRFFDPILVCMATPRRIQWMAKKELFLKPLRGVFSILGAFPVDRQSGGRAAIRTGLKLLGEGWALGIFPEGTRRKSVDGKYEASESEVKSGAILMAARSGAPIVPVYIDSVPSPLARLRGEKLHAYIGKPVFIEGGTRGRSAYSEAAKKMLDEIYALPKVDSE